LPSSIALGLSLDADAKRADMHQAKRSTKWSTHERREQ
jgi:adenosyl cobinamide kinase/adenosyl cobinamide phosphate guanylyltransferase